MVPTHPGCSALGWDELGEALGSLPGGPRGADQSHSAGSITPHCWSYPQGFARIYSNSHPGDRKSVTGTFSLAQSRPGFSHSEL